MAKYLKPDCEKGFLDDPADIEFEQFNNMRHTIDDFMLGDFDENGFYYVQPEIVQELIEMPKSLDGKQKKLVEELEQSISNNQYSKKKQFNDKL